MYFVVEENVFTRQKEERKKERIRRKALQFCKRRWILCFSICDVSVRIEGTKSLTGLQRENM
jgi:hypothetical protein